MNAFNLASLTLEAPQFYNAKQQIRFGNDLKHAPVDDFSLVLSIKDEKQHNNAENQLNLNYLLRGAKRIAGSKSPFCDICK